MIPQPTSSKSISDYSNEAIATVGSAIAQLIDQDAPDQQNLSEDHHRLLCWIYNQLAAEGERRFGHDLPSQLICPEHYCGE